MAQPVIAIEGIVASGKTTLCHELNRFFQGQLCIEDADAPRFREALQRYYDSPQVNALEFQLFVLERRSLQLLWALHEARRGERGEAVLQDRSLAGDRCIAEVHRNLANIDRYEWEVYRALWGVSMGKVPAPAVIVYLDIDPRVALERVQARGREAESRITLEYLFQQRNAYEAALDDILSGKHPWGRSTVVRVRAQPSVCAMGLAWHLWSRVSGEGYTLKPLCGISQPVTTTQILESEYTSTRLHNGVVAAG